MALIIMCAPREKILPVYNALNEFPFLRFTQKSAMQLLKTGIADFCNLSYLLFLYMFLHRT